MKYFTPKHSSGGFTLIELLTVIAVIGILAGILVPVVGGARFTAQKATARAEYGSIAAALGAFHMDYGFYPMAHSKYKDGVISFTTDEVDIVALLSGEVSGANLELNPRRKQYMQFSDNNIAGDDFPEANRGKYVDPFGNTDIAIVIATEGVVELDDFKDIGIKSQSGTSTAYKFAPTLTNYPVSKRGKFLIYGIGKLTPTKAEFVTYPALTTSQSTVNR